MNASSGSGLCPIRIVRDMPRQGYHSRRPPEHHLTHSLHALAHADDGAPPLPRRSRETHWHRDCVRRSERDRSEEVGTVTLEPSIADSIAGHALTAPASPAIIEAETGRRLTYATLHSRANRLARHLRALGVDRDRVVALALPRSADLVIAALATLRAGSVYAPFDPSTPVARLIEMLEDLQPAVVVARRSLGSSLPPGAWALIGLEADADVVAPEAAPASEFRGAPSDLAYVIYTSGSTGRPKGVEITRAALMNLVRWHNVAFAVTSADRAPLLASPGFDASVWEMWPYLAVGASLHVPPDLTRMDAETLRNWLVAREITLAFVATPMAERLLTLP